ncbi:hypothetical protein ACLOJK_033544, partial [Asimina triloba]
MKIAGDEEDRPGVLAGISIDEQELARQPFPERKTGSGSLCQRRRRSKGVITASEDCVRTAGWLASAEHGGVGVSLSECYGDDEFTAYARDLRTFLFTLVLELFDYEQLALCGDLVLWIFAVVGRERF